VDCGIHVTYTGCMVRKSEVTFGISQYSHLGNTETKLHNLCYVKSNKIGLFICLLISSWFRGADPVYAPKPTTSCMNINWHNCSKYDNAVGGNSIFCICHSLVNKVVCNKRLRQQPVSFSENKKMQTAQTRCRLRNLTISSKVRAADM